MPPPNPNRRSLGAEGEKIAGSHLERLGWRILAANYRCRQGEIDLIAEEPTEAGSVLVFVEVKLRRGNRYGSPAEAVRARKRERIIATAQAYLSERDAGGDEPACRFDIAEVFVTPDGLGRVVLHRGAFGSE